jgi:hypothetical protein
VKIIFLAYINRSGSTFLSNQLSKHHNIVSCPEAEILADLLLIHPKNLFPHYNNSIINLLLNDNKLKMWGLPSDVYNFPLSVKTCYDVFNYLLIKFRDKYRPDAEYILYKAERLFQLFPIISEIKGIKDSFYFIFLVRDIRAVYSSQANTIIPGTNRLFSNSPIATSLYWNRFINSVPKNRNEIIRIKYEDLILNFNNEIKRLLAKFCLTDNIMESSSSLSKFIPDNYKNIHKNIDMEPQISRVDAWKKNLRKKDLILIELVSAKYLSKCNYSLINKYQKFHYMNLNFLIEFLKISMKNFILKIIYRMNKNKDS